MCKTCNGTGGINIEHTWGITFNPCPDSHCDFVSDDSDIERLLAELDKRERESAWEKPPSIESVG